MILVDTSVLLDVLQNDPVWGAWSFEALRLARSQDVLAINDIIFAELCARYDRIEDVDAVVNLLGLTLQQIPRPALFLAGKAFALYRSRGGARTGVLSDFFISAHAAIAGATLLTRDAARVGAYFPTVEFRAPD